MKGKLILPAPASAINQKSRNRANNAIRTQISYRPRQVPSGHVLW